MYFMIYFITAYLIEKWFQNQRSEFGWLKNSMKCKKSGSAPSHWSAKKKWRWQAFMFLWDYIHIRTMAHDTMINVSSSDTESDTEDGPSANTRNSPGNSPSKRNSPKKTIKSVIKDKGVGKKSQRQGDELQASLKMLIETSGETNKQIRLFIHIVSSN